MELIISSVLICSRAGTPPLWYPDPCTLVWLPSTSSSLSKAGRAPWGRIVTSIVLVLTADEWHCQHGLMYAIELTHCFSRSRRRSRPPRVTVVDGMVGWSVSSISVHCWAVPFVPTWTPCSFEDLIRLKNLPVGGVASTTHIHTYFTSRWDPLPCNLPNLQCVLPVQPYGAQ